MQESKKIEKFDTAEARKAYDAANFMAIANINKVYFAAFMQMFRLIKAYDDLWNEYEKLLDKAEQDGMIGE